MRWVKPRPKEINAKDAQDQQEQKTNMQHGSLENNYPRRLIFHHKYILSVQALLLSPKMVVPILVKSKMCMIVVVVPWEKEHVVNPNNNFISIY